jgi:hypothetical protein
MAGRTLPTISGDQFGFPWASSQEELKRCAQLLVGRSRKPRSPHSKIQRALKAETLPGDLCLPMRKTTPFCAVQRDSGSSMVPANSHN